MQESIERYDPKTNIWEIMVIKVPHFMNSQIIFKPTSRTILLVGGNIMDSTGMIKEIFLCVPILSNLFVQINLCFFVETYDRTDRVFRLFIETNWIQEEIPLSKPVYSVSKLSYHVSNL